MRFYMKKRNIINLIRCYSENNDAGFRSEAYEIARDFDRDGDSDLAEYIMSLLSSANSFVPQENMEQLFFCQKVAIDNSTLPLPDAIKSDVVGIVNAIGHNAIVNKFLFQGAPGTGKTETVKQIARLTNRNLYVVNFDLLVDSKLGQTSKNIAALFEEINRLLMPERTIVLFDEIDASFDKALIRRFDAVVDFNRYMQEDLLEIGEFLLKEYIVQYKDVTQDIRLFKKILGLFPTIPYPGDLRNLIKTSLAFSSQTDKYDYLKRLYHSVTGQPPKDIYLLNKQGFTLRDIEILSGVSKRQVAGELNKKDE